MITRIAILLLSVSLFYSCGNDENEPMPDSLVIDLPADVSTGNSFLSGENAKSWSNDYFTLEMFGNLDCRTDDVFTFFSDGTYEYDGGADLCGDSDNQQIRTGTWTLNLIEGKITFDEGSDSEVSATIITLKENKVRLQGSWSTFAIDAMYLASSEN